MGHPGAYSSIEAASRRRRRRRLIEDILLLPLTLVLLFLEHVVWDGTKYLLNQLSRLRAVAALRRRLQTLPPLAVVFLFLIPEAFDHLSGFWATVLLLRDQVLAAAFVAIFIKGFAALIAIWIYQSCEESLLSVPWFRRFHDRVIEWSHWVNCRTAPLRHRARGWFRGGRMGRRLAAWRMRLAARFGISRS